MRQINYVTARRFALALFVCTGILWCTSAEAALQIHLSGLGRPVSLTDPEVKSRFWGLATELGVALGSSIMSPAETLGYSGFDFGLEMSGTPISKNAPYWQGQAGNRVWSENKEPSSIWATRLHVRKGLPFSFDVGATLSYMMGGLFVSTDMYGVGAELKWCLYESFFRYVPNLAARFAMNRLMGNHDLDLTQAQIDVISSLSFGVGGMVNMTPYVAGTMFTVHATSQVLDETPKDINDQTGDAAGSLFVLPEVNWQDNLQYRGTFGLRMIIYFIQILGEIDANFLKLPSGNKVLMSYSLKLGFDY